MAVDARAETIDPAADFVPEGKGHLPSHELLHGSWEFRHVQITLAKAIACNFDSDFTGPRFGNVGRDEFGGRLPLGHAERAHRIGQTLDLPSKPVPRVRS